MITSTTRELTESVMIFNERSNLLPGQLVPQEGPVAPHPQFLKVHEYLAQNQIHPLLHFMFGGAVKLHETGVDVLHQHPGDLAVFIKLGLVVVGKAAKRGTPLEFRQLLVVEEHPHGHTDGPKAVLEGPSDV